MRNKQSYIDTYQLIIEEDKQRYIKEHGTDEGYDWSCAAECISTAEEVVGYYISWYGKSALKEWLNNVKKKNWLSKKNDEKVTFILQELFSN